MWAYLGLTAAARSLWQFFFPPIIYNVKLPGVQILEADHNEQLICIIEISPPGEYQQEAMETLEPPQPEYKLRNDNMTEFETYCTTSYDNRHLIIRIFGILTVPGNYKIDAYFPEGSPITFTGQSVCKIRVTPGLLSDLRIVDREIPSTCYSFEKQSITVEGLDVCGNRCPLDTMQWELQLSETKKGLYQERVCTSGGDKIQYKFKYYFYRPGNYTVSIKPRSEMLSHVKVPANSFTVVVLSPFDAEKSVVRLLKKPPIFIDSGNVDIQVDLISNGPHYINNSEPCLEVRVNNEERTCSFLVDREEIEHGTCTLISNIKLPIGHTTVEIYHGDQLIEKKLNVDVEGVIPFNRRDYIGLSSQSQKKIRCKGVSIGFIIGADHANLNNINRVLEEADEISEDQISQDGDSIVLINMDNCKTRSAVSIVCDLLHFLIMGSHYRKQAYTFDSKRLHWKDKAKKAFDIKEHDKSTWCKSVKEKYGELMNKCHSEASEAIFTFYNDKRPQSEIDLHGQLTADEQKLSEYRKDHLHENSTHDEIEGIERQIRDMREQRDEAIRHLQKRLRTFDRVQSRRENCDWLEVIVGAGNHSDDKIPKIRPKVETFLSRKRIPYIECNPGSLLIPFSEYQGNQPCKANFFCKTKRCHRSWESTTSWKGKYQLCYKCDSNGRTSKCYPFKMRPAPKSKDVKRTSGNDFSRRDHVRLCEVCREQGRDCVSGVRL